MLPSEAPDPFLSSPSPVHEPASACHEDVLISPPPQPRLRRKPTRFRRGRQAAIASRVSQSPSRRSLSASASRLSRLSGLDVVKQLVEGYLEKRMPCDPSRSRRKSRSGSRGRKRIETRSRSRSRSRSKSRERGNRGRKTITTIAGNVRRKLRGSSTAAVLEFEKLLSDEVQRRQLRDGVMCMTLSLKHLIRF
jgi:hypothetical protein